MKKVLHIALNELLLLRKDKMAVIWMIVLPLGMTFIGGLVFGISWIVSKVKKQPRQKRFTLGGVLSLAGLIVVWVL